MLPQWWVWRSPCKEPSCIVILASDGGGGGGDDDGDDADVDNDDDNDDDDRNWVLSTSSGTFYMEPGFSLRNQPFHKTVPYITVKSFGVCYLFGKVGSLDLGGWAAGKLAVWLDLGKSTEGISLGGLPGCQANATHSSHNRSRRDHGKPGVRTERSRRVNCHHLRPQKMSVCLSME